MKQRPGTTLIEVLVSIFVMGIGMLALLTLFPLGALSMAQAIRDDRATHSAENAKAVATTADIRHDKAIYDPTNNIDVFTNPKDPSGDPPVLWLPDLSQVGSYDGPSYAVLVDPFGTFAPTPKAQAWVTGAYLKGSFGVPRRGVSFLPAPAPQSLFRYFTLMDDMLFTEDGGADLATTGEVNRDADFSWAYLLRRPRASIPSVVDMSIVVYNKRPLSQNLNAGLNPNEVAFRTTPNGFDNTAGTVTLMWNPGNGETPPVIRPNGWILDASIVPDPNNANNPGRPHGYFYRVTGVSDNGQLNQLELQVAGNNPFKDFPRGGTGTGVVIIMESVAEVFDMGTSWLP
jgi:type II secretory pathway pseudopilin PulG